MSIPGFTITRLLLLTSLLMSLNSAAAEYWVAQSGFASDDNPGTELQPWLTIGKAAMVARAGDTVTVKTGIYSGTNHEGSGYGIQIFNSGTEDLPIVFQSETPGAAVIDQDGLLPGFYIDELSHITITGFTIRNGVTGGVWVRHGAYINVSNNYIHDIDGPLGTNVGGIRLDGCAHCQASYNSIANITIAGVNTDIALSQNSAGIHSYNMSYATLNNNHIQHAFNGVFHKESTGEKGADVYSNIIHDVYHGITYGVKFSGSPPHVDQTFTNNLVYNATQGVFGWAHDASDYNTGLLIANNTFDTRLHGLVLHAYKGVDINSNILYQQERYTIHLGANSDRPTILDRSDYNCFYQTERFGLYPWSGGTDYWSKTDWTEATGHDSHSQVATTEPFKHTQSGLYVIDPASSCASAGVSGQPAGADITRERVGTSFLSRRLSKPVLIMRCVRDVCE